MNPPKILSISIFLLLFAYSSFAQENPFPNELPAYRFYGRGRLAEIRLGKSTHSDVRRVFGEGCDYVCVYDDDWFINFDFVGEHSGAELHNDRLVPQPIYIGKLYSISLQPKAAILFGRAKTLRLFRIGREWSATSEIGSWYQGKKYFDKHGLSYSVCVKSSDNCRNGELMSIDYEPSKKLLKEMFATRPQK